MSLGQTLAPTGGMHRKEIEKYSAWKKSRKAKQLVSRGFASADSGERPEGATSTFVRKRAGHDGRCVQSRRTTTALLLGKGLTKGSEQLNADGSVREDANPWLRLWVEDVGFAVRVGALPALPRDICEWRHCIRLTHAGVKKMQ